MLEGGLFVLQGKQHPSDPWNTANICFGTIHVQMKGKNNCYNNVYIVFRGITTFDPNKSALSKTRKERDMAQQAHKQRLERTTNCRSERLPPTTSRWASGSGKWPILSSLTPSVQLQALYRSLITIMSWSPGFQTLAHIHRAAQTTELIITIIAHRKGTLTQSI